MARFGSVEVNKALMAEMSSVELLAYNYILATINKYCVDIIML